MFNLAFIARVNRLAVSSYCKTASQQNASLKNTFIYNEALSQLENINLDITSQKEKDYHLGEHESGIQNPVHLCDSGVGLICVPNNPAILVKSCLNTEKESLSAVSENNPFYVTNDPGTDNSSNLNLENSFTSDTAVGVACAQGDSKSQDSSVLNIDNVSIIQHAPDAPLFCCGTGCPNCSWIVYAEQLKKYYGKNMDKQKIRQEVDKIEDPSVRMFVMLELGL